MKEQPEQRSSNATETSRSSQTATSSKSPPKKGYVLDDGEGDYRACRILPDGKLQILPNGFVSPAAVRRHIRQNPDTYARMQIMVIRVLNIMAVQVMTKTEVQISEKPRVIK